jgi:arginyl-tRNA synthetase
MKDKVIQVISDATGIDKKQIDLLVEVPKDSKLGDFAFPCFSLSREMKKNPIEIAKELVNKIKTGKEFEKIIAQGPYVNFFLNKNLLADDVLSNIIKQKDKYGSSKSNKDKVMIEFSQANTHKAFHVGHIRGTSFGESLCRIFEFLGNKVIRANYQGDTGMHVAKWIWCYKKYHSKEKLKEDESWVASIYVDAIKKLEDDEALQEEVNEINQKLESGKDKELMKLWKETRDLCLRALEKVYKELNTKFDRYYFEREVEIPGKEIAQNLAKEGIAKVSDGATIMDLNDIGLSVWVLLRKDGTVLYSSKDLALAMLKFKEYKLDKSINIVADEQNLHFKQLFKTLELMKFKDVKKCQHIPYALVRLPEGKMSSRTGNNILYSDFLDEMKDYAKSEIEKREKVPEKELEERALKISVAAIKYAMLKQHSNSVIVFNKEEALNFEGNTGSYLLYSYARAKSILNKAKYKKSSYKVASINEKEKALINQLNNFPKIVQHSYEQLSPNLIANYAFELSQSFNEFYHSSQVIGSKEEQFRLALVSCFSQVLKNALFLLGIDVIEKM